MIKFGNILRKKAIKVYDSVLNIDDGSIEAKYNIKHLHWKLWEI